MRLTPQPRDSRLTVRMLAAEAGVSPATVSKVMNRRPGVSAATRDRVERVLDRHRAHRRPARDRPGLIVDLVLNALDSQWSAQILTAAEEVLRGAGATTAISALHADPARTLAWLDRLHDRRCDGVVLVASEPSPRQHLLLASRGLPVVVMDPVGTVEAAVPTVTATNWAGALAATEHLVALGHRHVVHLPGPATLLCARARADGYRTALRRAGLPVPAGWPRPGGFDTASGHAQTVALLDEARRAGAPPPTALFAASDHQAMGAHTALRAHGLRVPEDVSLVGFDDLPLSRYADPPLTTVRQPVADMAALAARTLLRLIDGGTVDPPRPEVPTRLVERASTAPPRAGAAPAWGP
jgi:LacI family transcriptional regulator